MRNNFLALSAISLFLTACQMYQPEEKALDGAPEKFAQVDQKVASEMNLEQWWQEFENPELNDLMDELVSNNLTLKESTARLRQFEALRRIASSGQELQLNYSSGVGETHRRFKDTPTTGNDSINQLSLGLSASYEVDLWGRLDAQENAAFYDAASAAEDLNAAAMTLTSLLAESWLELHLQWNLKDIANNQLKTNKKLLDILENRQSRGLATAVDVFQQRSAVARVEAELPLFERREKILLNEINILLGRAPQAQLELKHSTSLPNLKPLPQVGLPTELLTRRPDLRAYQAQLRSREWGLTEAQTAKLPNLVIGGDFSFAHDDVDYFFENWSRSIAANLVGPILDGGRRDSEIARQKARIDETMSAYRQAFYRALADVEDALIQEKTQVAHLAARKRQLESSQRALEEATQRYLNGLSDFIPVISEILNSQQLQLEVQNQEFEKMRFRIGLYRALGGGPKMIDIKVVAGQTNDSNGEQK